MAFGLLRDLFIENIAVIEKAEIPFQPGFNVLTGETGAGKSIVIDSINAIMGGRTSRDLVRTGARAAFVSAMFSGIGEAATETLASLGYSLEEDGTLLLQREIRPEGKTTCRINGRPASVSIFRTLAPFLISIQGQHESYDLLSPETHMNYIDAVGGYEDLKAEYRKAYETLKRIGKELDDTDLDESQKARRMDILTYQINELEAANLRLGEKEELIARKARIQNGEQIAKALAFAIAAMDGTEEGGALSAVSDTAAALEQTERVCPELAPVAEKLREAEYLLEDCAAEIRQQASRMEFNEQELDEIEERLDVLYRLGLKYGASEEEMLAFLETAQKERESIVLSDENRERLTAEFEQAKEQAVALAKALSAKRRTTAVEFETRVMEELRFLDMPGVVFQAQRTRCPLNASGCDEIHFLISVNPGETPKPISKIASGGELSRIMLAIKTVLSGKGSTDTMIFDEVDTGISGSAAQKVGQKLKETARSAQVLCVTHLAQIAAMADAHFRIQKEVHDGKTFTHVTPLSFEERTQELARIMGGSEITPLMLKNAAEMIQRGKKL